MGSNPVEVLKFSAFSIQLLKIAFLTARIIASLNLTIVNNRLKTTDPHQMPLGENIVGGYLPQFILWISVPLGMKKSKKSFGTTP